MLQAPLETPVPDGRSLFNAGAELTRLGDAQRRLLPQAAPPWPGYALHLAYRPAYFATGDYHDFFPRSDGLAVFVGDGSGHGPTASLLMATMRTLLRSHPELHTDPGATLTATNGLFSDLIPSDLFMTGVYLLLGPGGRVHWAAAGHDPPLRVDRAGRLGRVDLEPVGLPLAIGTCSYATVAWRLELGERLLLFTDGLVEVRSRAEEPFGRRRVRAHLSRTARAPLRETVEELVARATAHMEGGDFEDDFTVVGVERV